VSVLDGGRRWLRTRRARRLRRRARSLDPADADGVVEACRALANGRGGDERLLAVEGLEAVARKGTDHPVRDAAVDALLATVRGGGDRVGAAAVRSLRYVGLDREAAVPRLDGPVSTALDRWDHPGHDRIAVDAGMLLGRADPRHDLPAVRETLLECLAGGPRDVREHAAVAYVLAADDPDRFDRPREVREHLSILRGAVDGELPAPDSPARRLADDRTLRDAVDALGGGGRRG
jgi:hypothetical protein